MYSVHDLKVNLWNRGNLSWKLWKQQEIIYNTIRSLPLSVQTVVLLCSRQFGKSVLGTLLGLEDCLQNPGVVVMIVAPELKQARAIVNPRMKMLAADAPPGLIDFKKSEDTWYIGESELVLGGFDVKNATRQRGKTLHKIYVEEIVDSNPDDYTTSIRSDLGPALTHSKHAQIVFLTTPPKIEDHPFLIDTCVEAKLNNAYFEYTINDNKQLTKEQYDRCVRLAGGIDSEDFRREYLCQVVRDSKRTVIPHFEEQRHVKEFELPLETNYQITIDFGGVRDKTVALLHTYDFYNNKHLWINEAVFSANTPTDVILNSIINNLESMVDVNTRVADAPGQLRIDLQKMFGYSVVSPAKNDWRSSVNTMSAKFSLDETLIHPRCKFLIQSCRSGIFNKNITDFERTEALGHCDALAAMMYGFRTAKTHNPYSPIIKKTASNQMFIRNEDETAHEQLANKIKTFTTNRKMGVFRK